MKLLLDVRRNAGGHWVGDGFPVRTLFSYQDSTSTTSPFLMLDYGGPHVFEPAPSPRGVGRHPHRGFETVTIVFDGEIEHGDSAGNSGSIGPGDVQWMTAASGVVHEEFHSREFTARGGPFEMVQLWVNLPASEKMSAPRYQGIRSSDIPTVELPAGAGRARLIAGSFGNARGPARTVTPISVWDLRLAAGHDVRLPIAAGHNAMLVVLRGQVTVGERTVEDASVAVFDRGGQDIGFKTTQETHALLLAGEPIDEPVVGYGPFVMNTQDEIRTAIRDYQTGRMGV